MFNLFLISVIIVIITDLSGYVDYFKRFLWKILFKKLPYNNNWEIKILECAFCQTFWIGTIYLLFIGWTIPLQTYVLILAYFTPVTKDLLIIIKELIIKLLNKIC